MLEFSLPVFPADFPPDRFSLSIWSTFNLTAEETDSLRRELGEDFIGHQSVRETVDFGGGAAEIRALIGIHEPKVQQEVDLFGHEPRPHWVHFSVDFVAGIQGRENRTRAWATVYNAVCTILTPRALNVTAFWSLPRSSFTFAVALPIPLQGDIPGFTDIRGVRLAEPDPDNPGSDLYSLILDHYETSASVQVRTTLEGMLSSDLLQKATDRALSIVELAVGRTQNDD